MKHLIKDLMPPRKLSSFEYRLLSHILSHNFVGQSELFRQIDYAEVASECETCRTVEFVIPPTYLRANVTRRVPVEAVGEDSDGVKIHFLVHVIDGYISELEIYREDSKNILKMPEIRSLKVMSLDTDETW